MTCRVFKSVVLAISVPFLCSAENFSEDIFPIVRARCQTCHQEGEIAPMAFTNYENTRPWAKAIREAVVTGPCRPGMPTAFKLEFHNDRSLPLRRFRSLSRGSTEERRRSEDGLSGARQARKWLETRQTGYRSAGSGIKVPARGDVPYTFVIRSLGLTKDRWVRAAEFRIDKRAVVHHMNAFVRPPVRAIWGIRARPIFVPTLKQRRIGRPGEGMFERRELLLGYEPGYLPIPWREDQAKLVRAGSDIVFEIHYTANGKDHTDYSEFGLYFSDTRPRERVLSTQTQDMEIAIPPGDADYKSTASITFGQPVKLISLQPHMHLRGKAMEIRARYPDGRTETLLDVPRYSFNWQTTYFLKEPKLLPADVRSNRLRYLITPRTIPIIPIPRRRSSGAIKVGKKCTSASWRLRLRQKRTPKQLSTLPPRNERRSDSNVLLKLRDKS